MPLRYARTARTDNATVLGRRIDLALAPGVQRVVDEQTALQQDLVVEGGSLATAVWPVCVGCAGRVERVPAQFLRSGQHGIGWNVDDLRIQINESSRRARLRRGHSA